MEEALDLSSDRLLNNNNNNMDIKKTLKEHKLAEGVFQKYVPSIAVQLYFHWSF